MDTKNTDPNPQSASNEGEGSVTADRRYRSGVERTVRQGDTDKLGKKAAEALDGPEGDELRKAEQDAKIGRTGTDR